MAKLTQVATAVLASLTPEQKAHATTVFDAQAAHHDATQVDWQPILDAINGDPSGALRTEYQTLNKARWLKRAQDAAKAKGVELTPEDIAKVYTNARSNFNEYTANGGKRAPRAARPTAATVATENAAKTAAAVKDALSKAGITDEKKIAEIVGAQNAAILAVPGPGLVAGLESAHKDTVSMVAAWAAFQTAFSKARIPAKDKDELSKMLGDIGEGAAKLRDAIGKLHSDAAK